MEDTKGRAPALAEPAGPSPVVGSGGVVGLRSSEAEDIARWLMHMIDLYNQLAEAEAKRGNATDALKFRHYVSAFDTAHTKFRRQMVSMTERQPEPNKELSNSDPS